MIVEIDKYIKFIEQNKNKNILKKHYEVKSIIWVTCLTS